jgi:cyclopropane fatty-acyl-phospholipid synthase-like methyltransferase
MNQEYWEQRYQAGDMPWEKGEPSPGLVDFLAAHPNLARGNVAVPGCGTGHDVRAWSKAGFNAFGFDLTKSAVQLANEKTQAMGLSATFQTANFLKDEPPFLFDWLFEHTLFCAIEPTLRDDYVRAVRKWLNPGGQYLAVNYFIPDTDGPPFGTTRDEQLRLFSPYFDLVEDWVPRSYPNRTGLERMFWWRKKLNADRDEAFSGDAKGD